MTKQQYIEKYGEQAWEKRLESSRNWNESHKAERAESNRKWRKAHPEYDKEHYGIYQKNIGRSKPYMEQYRLTHTQCECCFNPTEEIHHIIPLPNDRLLDFGDSLLTEDNLMALCIDCHKKIHKEMNK